MVNSMGHEFADSTGASINVVPGQGDVTIDKEGQVFQMEQLVGQVGVFVFENPLLDLQKVGGGFVAKEEDIVPETADPENFTILQGFLEK